jgi:hypothetical protein
MNVVTISISNSAGARPGQSSHQLGEKQQTGPHSSRIRCGSNSPTTPIILTTNATPIPAAALGDQFSLDSFDSGAPVIELRFAQSQAHTVALHGNHSAPLPSTVTRSGGENREQLGP